VTFIHHNKQKISQSSLTSTIEGFSEIKQVYKRIVISFRKRTPCTLHLNSDVKIPGGAC